MSHDSELVLWALALILHNQELQMSTLADLTAADAELDTEVQAISADVDTLNAQIASLQQQLANASGLSPADQAALDAAVTDVSNQAAALKAKLPAASAPPAG